MKEDLNNIIEKLKSKGGPEVKENMGKFKIKLGNSLGVSVKEIRGLAKGIGKNHGLALRPWDTGIHEARIMASIIDDYQKVTVKQMKAG